MLVNPWYINEIIDSWVSHLIFSFTAIFHVGLKGGKQKHNVLYEEQLWLTLILRHSSSEPNSRDQALWRVWQGRGSAALMGLVSRASSLPEKLAWELTRVLTVHPTTKASVIPFVISWEFAHPPNALGCFIVLLAGNWVSLLEYLLSTNHYPRCLKCNTSLPPHCCFPEATAPRMPRS